MSDDYYKTLEVHPDVSIEDIKKAFREKARLNHPDKGGDPNVFKKIMSAYETLSDPVKRQEYDNMRNSTNINQSYIFDNLFNSFFQQRINVHHVKIQLSDVYRGLQTVIFKLHNIIYLLLKIN